MDSEQIEDGGIIVEESASTSAGDNGKKVS